MLGPGTDITSFSVEWDVERPRHPHTRYEMVLGPLRELSLRSNAYRWCRMKPVKDIGLQEEKNRDTSGKRCFCCLERKAYGGAEGRVSSEQSQVADVDTDFPKNGVMLQCSHCSWHFCTSCYEKGMGRSHPHKPLIATHLKQPVPPRDYYRILVDGPVGAHQRGCDQCGGKLSNYHALFSILPGPYTCLGLCSRACYHALIITQLYMFTSS